MDATVKGLVPSDEYVVRAFVTNGINTVYSEEKHFSTSSEERIVIFRDVNFKALILEGYDSNDDGQISTDEALTVTKLNLCTDNISSLEGIECFPNLTHLTCSGSGGLTELDLTANNRLRELNVEGNKLKELLLPKNDSRMEVIHCVNNRLTSLDLSGCPNLRILRCWENSLSVLDLSGNLSLEELDCAQNFFFDGLDLSHNTKLKILACNEDCLPSIDIGNNVELTEFLCCYNSIKSLDVSQNIGLKDFKCDFNQLEKIDVTMLQSLEILSIGDNPIKGPVDLSGCPQLRFYGGNNLPLPDVPDFSHNPNLDSIHICGSGGAKYIDKDFFRDWPNVRDFQIGLYRGETIDLSLNSKMEHLWMGDMSNVRILDLSASPNLKYIDLAGDKVLEKVYVHKDVDISRLEVRTDDEVHAEILYKP